MKNPVPVIVLKACRAAGKPLKPGKTPVTISARDAELLETPGYVTRHVPSADEPPSKSISEPKTDSAQASE